MNGHYEIIDESNWKRAMHCHIFRNYVEPGFCVTVELDVTHFLQYIRSKQYSFTMALVYTISKCANEIPEFRYRFLDGKVVLYDQIQTAFTYLNADTELFKVVRVDMQDSMEDYVVLATKTAKKQTAYFTGPLGNDVFQFSPLPWLSYTHISHTISGQMEMATPLFDWGKYHEHEGRILLPFSIQAHHSFVDGLHVGRLVESIQTYLDTL